MVATSLRKASREGLTNTISRSKDHRDAVTPVKEQASARTSRPPRQAVQRSAKERRTSGLYEGGALDSQLSDSQYIRDLINKDKKAGKGNMSVITVISSSSDEEPEPARESPHVAHNHEVPDLPSDTLVGQSNYQDFGDGATFNGTGGSKTSGTPGMGTGTAHTKGLSVVAQLMPHELVALESIGMLLLRYRRQQQEAEKQRDEVCEAHFELMREVRFLEDYNGRLRGALDEHDIELPGIEDSQFV
ncbi:hypothetical protein FKP32DRAFT_1671053 [Trametes sanguinea]|nr:hypothetical protein FKP32DRAFT_1671053 [Trametes sanguinea]